MKTMFRKIFNLVAGGASIIGVLFLFFTDKQVGVVALLAFCLFLLGMLISVCVGVWQIIKNENPETYRKITSFTSFETSDGIHGVYEVFKVIQFNQFSKSYQYYLTDPEIGYYYRLEWEK